jgi:asparagine synthase (glutamine-hydrolysing)
MPGLVGIVGLAGPDEAARRFDAAVKRMRRFGGVTVDARRFLDDRCLVAHVRLADRAVEPSNPGTIGPALFFHGVLHNAEALRGETSTESGASVEAVLAALYSKHGEAFVERLHGEFVVAVVDAERSRLLLATDPVGTYPLYWWTGADGLMFSSDLSAILAATPEARQLNLRAVADYVTVGFVVGDKTLARGVRALDPGTVLSCDAARGHVSERTYFRVESLFGNKRTDKAHYFQDLEAAFHGAVTRAMGGPRQIGLSLSGGLDSRAILSHTGGGAGLRTYTLGVEGCADQVIATRLSAIAGTKHHYFKLDDRYLRDFLPNMAKMVSMTDGMYLSHGLTEILAQQFIGDTGIEVLLRGHGGELAKAHLAWPLHTEPGVYALASADDVAAYLSRRANYVTPNLPLASFFSGNAAAEAGAGAADSFATTLAGIKLTPAECCSYLYLRELNRRFTVPSLELFRTRVDVRLPFVDVQYLKVLLSAPSAWRDSTEIHRRLTGAGNPRLLRVRNSNTGAAANAGPRTEFVLDKLNTLLRRMNVRGYRHYHNFDAWMRRMLLESVEAELLAADARIRHVVRRDALTSLIRETREGAADRSYLLQVLLILELWLRENQVEAAA